MKQRNIFTVIIIAVVFALITTSVLMFFNSDFYYSKRLVRAISDDNITEVKRLIEAKPTCINTYPTLTSHWFQVWVLDYKIEHPINLACIYGNKDIIELLVNNGADVNCYDDATPLSITYRQKKDDWYTISQLLLNNGADINYTTAYSAGKSAVLMDIVQVRPGASKPDYIPESEEEVMRAFHYALERCDLESVDWPWVLFETVSNDRHELVKELLDNNYVDVNDTDDGEMSALMAAARDSDLAMVELLLDYGADPFYMTAEGETALDYALKDNNREISDYLKEYMGESIKRLYLY